jgi:hypothetical protein
MLGLYWYYFGVFTVYISNLLPLVIAMVVVEVLVEHAIGMLP